MKLRLFLVCALALGGLVLTPRPSWAQDAAAIEGEETEELRALRLAGSAFDGKWRYTVPVATPARAATAATCASR